MKRRLIVTDLTRLSEKLGTVCMAGIDVATKECIRPMPHLTIDGCSKQNILPGSIVEGDFKYIDKSKAPHAEDCFRKDFMKTGACSSEEFLKMLTDSDVNSIEEGFGAPLIPMKNCISHEHADDINASIITIEIPPTSLYLVSTQYKAQEVKVKVNIKDNAGLCLHKVALTDLGYYNFIKAQVDITSTLETENSFIRSQDRVFLRIGVGRQFKINENDGFWLQINGIYTFPEFNAEIRSYK